MSFGEGISEGASVEKLLLHLNGNSNDDSGNGYNGIDTNVIYSKSYGKFNEGARFAQSNSKITIADNSALRFTNNFTVSLWFYTTNTDSGQHCYVSKSRVVAGDYTGWVINKYASQQIGFVIFKGGQELDALYIPLTNLLGKWSLIHCIKDNNVMKIYVDGELKVTGSCGNMIYSIHDLIIGNSTTIYGFADANIDEVRIRTRVVSAQEIKKEYTNALGRFGIT